MRSIFIDRRLTNRPLLDVLQASFKLKPKDALNALRERQVRICGGVCVDPARRVKVGQHIQLESKSASTDKPELPTVAKQIVVRYMDDQIVVVDKPAGVTTVRHADEIESLGKRAKKFLPPTLADLLPAVLAQNSKAVKGRIRAVHRLDKDTSGLVVFARTSEAESHLGKQFRAHTTGRHYLGLVRGSAQDARIETHFVPDRGDGRRGSGETGQLAITHVRVVEAFDAFTLVECVLETGRTHQVRIHLGEIGTPLCGERVYDRPPHGKPLPDTSGAKRPMLHAAYLAIDHPKTGKRMEWHAKMPKDMTEIIVAVSRDPQGSAD